MPDQLTFFFSSAQDISDRGRLKGRVSVCAARHQKGVELRRPSFPLDIRRRINCRSQQTTRPFLFHSRRLAVARKIAKSFAPACNKRQIRRFPT